MAQTKIKAGGFDADVITGTTALTTEPDSTDELLISDGGTLKRLDIDTIYNTPAFQARATSNQNVDDATSTKMEFDTEDYDTDSAYDASNDQFTVPSGKGGKYFLYAKAKISCGTVNTLNSSVLLFRIGSNERYGLEFFGNGIVSGTVETVQASGLNITATLDLSAGDVVSVYGYANVSSGQAQFQTGDNYSIYFGGYRISGTS
jgi:hypothetical protein|tara:strand:+ start:48 stop:659 length:612 start_codon:yes stop_codon:yes gene_type:complete